MKLESEVGIGPTFAVLQTDAYSSIDNSPMLKWQEHPELNRILGIWSPRHNHIYHAPMKWQGLRESNPHLVFRRHTFWSVILNPHMKS